MSDISKQQLHSARHKTFSLHELNRANRILTNKSLMMLQGYDPHDTIYVLNVLTGTQRKEVVDLILQHIKTNANQILDSKYSNID